MTIITKLGNTLYPLPHTGYPINRYDGLVEIYQDIQRNGYNQRKHSHAILNELEEKSDYIHEIDVIEDAWAIARGELNRLSLALETIDELEKHGW